MKYVIIGNGIAGTNALESIRRFDPEGEIKVYGDETLPPYCRPMISHLLEGVVGPERLPVRSRDFYDKHRADAMLGQRICAIDADQKQVELPTGKTVSYDRLLLATGADPRPVDAEGTDLENIFFMRTEAQVRGMVKRLPDVRRALVLGGGLVGFKAAYGLLRRNIAVTMLIGSGYPLSMQVDETAGKMIQAVLEERGLEVRTGVSVAAFEGNGRVREALLSDGNRVACDMAVIGKGVSPAGRFLPADKIDMETGILVNSRMETSCPDIYAAGDIAECLDIARGYYRVNAIWPEAVSQGRVAGMNMAGIPTDYRGSVSRNVIRIFDLDVMSGGTLDDRDMDDTCRTVVFEDRRRRIYRKLVLKDNILIGFVLVGKIDAGGILASQVQSRMPVMLSDSELASVDLNFATIYSHARYGGTTHTEDAS